MDILAQYKTTFLILHLIAVAWGVGGATIADFLFFNFLKDLSISKGESKLLKSLSKIIWIALGLFVISGLGLYLPEMARLNQTPKFLVKVIVVGVIVLNGLVLHHVISPKLTQMPFHEGQRGATSKPLTKLRKMAFASGAISITSWYSALILGTLKNVELGFGMLLSMYCVIVAGAIVISQIFEQKIYKLKK